MFDVETTKITEGIELPESVNAVEGYDMLIALSQYKVKIQSKSGCFDTDFFVEFNSGTSQQEFSNEFTNRTGNFSAFFCFIMLCLIFAYNMEINKFARDFLSRLYTPDNHGQTIICYSTEWSFLSQ